MSTVRTISKESLLERIGRGDIQVLNVLEPEYYNLGFIESSISIPLSELGNRTEELNKAMDVVVYCADDECNASHDAAEILMNKGFNVARYPEGIRGWKMAGYPVEKEPKAA